MPIENARIKDAHLGADGVCITVSQPSGDQGTGMIPLAEDTILTMLLVGGVREWDNLKGKYVRIERNGEGRIVRLGHIINEDWLEI
jgi:hypothetical protein